MEGHYKSRETEKDLLIEAITDTPITIRHGSAEQVIRFEDAIYNKTRFTLTPGSMADGVLIIHLSMEEWSQVLDDGAFLTVVVEDYLGKKYSSADIKPVKTDGFLPYPGGEIRTSPSGASSPPAKVVPIVTLQLMPAVDEEHARSIPVTGASIIFANNTGHTVRDISKLMLLPPIKSVKIPDVDRQRIKIVAGNKKRSIFVHIEIPELLVGEHRRVEVMFLQPQPFTSTDVWGRQYGYTGEDVMVYRLFIGPERKVEK